MRQLLECIRWNGQTGKWCAKDINHVGHLVSLHTQCVQGIMILDILDVQFVGGDADNGPCAVGEPKAVKGPGINWCARRASANNRNLDVCDQSHTCIVRHGRPDYRNRPRTTCSPQLASALEIWKVDGNRHYKQDGSRTTRERK